MGYAISEALASIFYQAMPREIAVVVLNNCRFILLFYQLYVIIMRFGVEVVGLISRQIVD